jgi:plasmid stability protein
LTYHQNGVILVPLWNRNDTVSFVFLDCSGGSRVATITVKDIPDDLYEALKRCAAAHHRSINREVIHCIEQSVHGHDPDAHGAQWDEAKRMTVDEILEEVRRLRQEIGPPAAKGDDQQSGNQKHVE